MQTDPETGPQNPDPDAVDPQTGMTPRQAAETVALVAPAIDPILGDAFVAGYACANPPFGYTKVWIAARDTLRAWHATRSAALLAERDAGRWRQVEDERPPDGETVQIVLSGPYHGPDHAHRDHDRWDNDNWNGSYEVMPTDWWRSVVKPPGASTP